MDDLHHRPSPVGLLKIGVLPVTGGRGYPLRMKAMVKVALVMLLGTLVCATVVAQSVPAAEDVDLQAVSEADSREQLAATLAGIVDSIEPISEEVRVRRSLAQAVLCLPQNVLGILYYAVNQLIGSVLCTQEMNEMTVVVTRLPFGASLGRHIFVSEPFLTERIVRHEYGHTMQGYMHGPFYLLLEGTASFVQLVASVLVPSLAPGYYDRWPESEADELGGALDAF